KGICLTPPPLTPRVAQFTNSCHLNSTDRIILLGSAVTTAGNRNLFGAILNGATLIIADFRSIGVHGVLRTFEHEQVTVCSTVPALLREPMRAHGAKESFARVRLIRLGGDA